MTLEKLTLKTPIRIKGKDIKELEYDVEELSVENVANADIERFRIPGANVNTAKLAEMDLSLHFYVGMQAIIIKNPEVGIDELKQLKGADAASLMRIGRSFFSLTSQEALTQNSSGGQQETTLEPLPAQ